MKISNCEIEGLLIIELDIFNDNRGFFTERYNKKKFNDLGINIDFIQDNHSRSKYNVIRGLHMQNNLPQAKLVSVSSGSIIDIAVDLRFNSKTYGKYFSIELSDINGKMLLIPAGLAHGFMVNNINGADVLYKVDTIHNPKSQIGISWNDKDINIDWGITDPIMSDNDKNCISLADYERLHIGKM